MGDLKEQLEGKFDEVKDKADKEYKEELAVVREEGLVGWFNQLDNKEKFAALAVVLIVGTFVIAGVCALF